MMQRVRFVSDWLAALLIILCGCPEPAQAITAVPAFEATYKIKRSGFSLGKTRLRLEVAADGHYVYDSRTELTGIVSWFRKDRVHESSQGIMTDKLIRPQHYRFRRTGGEKDKHAEITFDWEARQVENRVDGTPWKMDIPEGTLDKLIVQIAMMRKLQEKLADQHFRIADGGKLKDYRVFIRAHEILDLPAGRFETVKIEKEPENRKRKTYLWLAPELGYLPVQIMRQEKDGSVYYSRLEEVSDALRIDKRPDRVSQDTEGARK